MAWHGYVLLSVNPALADTWDEGKTWAESRAACEAYIQANRATWEAESV